MSIWKSIGSFFSSLFQKKESIKVETVSTNDKQQEDTVVEEITKPIVIETDTDKDNTVEVTEDVSDTMDNDITIDKITIDDSDNSEESVKEEPKVEEKKPEIAPVVKTEEKKLSNDVQDYLNQLFGN